MAYKFMRDGEVIIHFENGVWDSLWGYTSRNCGKGFGDTQSAYEHDCNQPCKDETWRKENKFTWTARISIRNGGVG
jgi:hypothetical protein